MRSAEFEGAESDDSAKDAKDVEPCDDLGFVPAKPFEMVMERGHSKDSKAGAGAAAGVFEPGGLDNDGEGFDDKDATGDQENERLMDQDGHDSERAAEREGSGIPHENLRGVAVEPEESETGTEHGGAEDREFAGARHEGDLEVRGEVTIAGDVGKNDESGSDDESAADGEAVKAVGEIDGVGAADDGQESEEEAGAGGIDENWVFIERHHDLGDERAGGGAFPEVNADEKGEDDLDGQFDHGGGAFAALLGDFRVIIIEAKSGENNQRKQGQENKSIPLSPEQGAEIKDGHDEDASHGGGAALIENAGAHAAGLFGFVSVVLSEFELLEPVNDFWAEPKAEDQRSDRGPGATE